MEHVLRMAAVTKSYPTEQGTGGLALSPVDLDIRRGEFVSLIGPSGCGKTTLLKIASGLLAASSGTVYFEGQPGTPPPDRMRVVFQSPSLLPWRTVLDNVVFPGIIQRTNGLDLRARARALLEMLNLGPHEAKYPWELSGGMQQRVSIARALLLEPEVIFMDEPFGALDAMTREKLNADVQDLHLRNSATFLFVTHNIHEAIYLSDRVVALTPSPGAVSEVIDVDLPRPRTQDIYSTPEFGELERQIRNAFETAVRA